MAQIQLPTTLEEIPTQLMAAWTNLGLENYPNCRVNYQDKWNNNKILGSRIRIALSELTLKKIPVEHFPNWFEAISNILEKQAAEAQEKDHFLASALSYFLEGAQLVSLPVIQPAFMHKQLGLLGIATPRTADECFHLIDLLPTIRNEEIQKRLLKIIFRYHDPAIISERNSRLSMVLPQLPSEAFDSGQLLKFSDKTALQSLYWRLQAETCMHQDEIIPSYFSILSQLNLKQPQY